MNFLKALVLLLLPFIAFGDDFSDRLVNAHNSWREKVAVPPVKWSENLAAFAQQWADHLARDNSCEMAHRGASGDLNERRLAGDITGENLAWKWQSVKYAGFLFTPEEVVDAWGTEDINYDPERGNCSGGMCGHYTQMVWRSTEEVGCGRASCGLREIWVCNYLPAGNYVGRKAY